MLTRSCGEFARCCGRVAYSAARTRWARGWSRLFAEEGAGGPGAPRADEERRRAAARDVVEPGAGRRRVARRSGAAAGAARGARDGVAAPGAARDGVAARGAARHEAAQDEPAAVGSALALGDLRLPLVGAWAGADPAKPIGSGPGVAVERFWLSPVPLTGKAAPVLATEPDLLLRQLPTPGPRLGGAALIDALRLLYKRFG